MYLFVAAVVITIRTFCCFSVFFFGLGHKSPLCCAAMLECFAALHSLSSLQTEGGIVLDAVRIQTARAENM
jgi:hypothetical protein